jgi:hypothetical protein
MHINININNFLGVKVENVKAESSSSSSEAKNVKKQSKGFDINMPTLKRLLELLRLDAVNMLGKVPNSDHLEGGPMYTVNMDGIISTLRHRTLHSIAVDRYLFQHSSMSIRHCIGCYYNVCFFSYLSYIDIESGIIYV